MNDAIMIELRFFIVSIMWGGVLLIIYDGLRIFRNTVKHKTFIVVMEDILYWVVCGFLIFRMMYEQNNGIIRGFSILGMLIGMLLYHWIFSEVLVETISNFINKIKYVLGIILGFLFKPFTLVFRLLKRLFGKLFSKAKKGGNKVSKSLKKRKKSSKIPVIGKGEGDTVEK